MLSASLADAKQYTPIPAGMLSRHKAHPCRQVPAILEVGPIPKSGNDCRCSLGPTPRIFAIRWQTSLSRKTASICLSKYLIFWLSCRRKA
ncbi:hypothetical protein RHAB21_01311 [Pseudorhizobium halotolerans]|uniref:Uncharacterized protein n=1 Tax=Pseudorhizobium halotolerans TaxID=1233081 RepID=A0ABM8PFC1_9HYPH|nr:hypothetical protein RHAB21_01311 [Pseudorhizobium halotolerans]